MAEEDTGAPDGDAVATTHADRRDTYREPYRDPNTDREITRAREEAKRFRQERDDYRREIERLRADVTDKIKESDGLRGRLKQVGDELHAAKADREQTEKSLTEERLRVEGELKAAHEAALTDFGAKAKQRLIHAELKAAALRAGMVDPDGLKLLDLTAADLTDDGSVSLPNGFWDQAKEAKPYLFGTPQPTTSTTTRPPPPVEPPKVLRATDMTAEQANELERRILSTGRAA